MLYITVAFRLPCMLLRSSSLACACHGCVLYETALSMPLFLLVLYPSALRFSKVVTCSPLLGLLLARDTSLCLRRPRS